MSKTSANQFFPKEIYDAEIRLDVNDDVLERIYSAGVRPTDKLGIEFFFITDSQQKAQHLSERLISDFPSYLDIKVEETEDYWEVTGITSIIEMNITEINKWNQLMWHIGYEYDCQLDGWQVGT